MSEDAVKLQGMIPPHLKVRQSKILLDSLEVMTDIGFHEFEVGKPQRLLISVELWLEEFEAPSSDDPVHAWNYDYLKNEVIRIAQERQALNREGSPPTRRLPHGPGQAHRSAASAPAH